MRTRAPLRVLFGAAIICTIPVLAFGQHSSETPVDDFEWPDDHEAAVSLSFDDARPSQIDAGLPFFERHDVQVTFYVVPSNVRERIEGWKAAVADGHEIANHSWSHPCSGNFAFSRENALEQYTLDQMRVELEKTSRWLDEHLGVRAKSFAYPCGQKYVGRGRDAKSYVPVAADLFTSARGWLDEAPNDPAYVDAAQLTGVRMDDRSFDQIRPLLEQIQEDGRWLVLAGHDVGSEGAHQTTSLEMLEKLFEYVRRPENDVWLAPVGTIADYVTEYRRSAE